MDKCQNPVIKMTNHMNFKRYDGCKLAHEKTSKHHIIREIQIKITRFHYTPIIPLKLGSLEHTRSEYGYKETGTLVLVFLVRM